MPAAATPSRPVGAREVPPGDPTFGLYRIGTKCRRPAQPKRLIVRLMPVIADPTLHPRRLVAVEVLLRALEIVLVATLLFWILPVIADAAG